MAVVAGGGGRAWRWMLVGGVRLKDGLSARTSSVTDDPDYLTGEVAELINRLKQIRIVFIGLSGGSLCL